MKTADLFDSLYGYPAGSPEPEDFQVFKRVEDDFLDDLAQQGAAVVTALSKLSSAANLDRYLQYIFYLWVERQQDWPSMAPRQKAFLLLGKECMAYGGWVPNYGSKINIPDDPAVERQIDSLLISLAVWCQKVLGMEILKDFSMSLRKHRDSFIRLHPEIPKNEILVGFNFAFVEMLQKYPMNFQRASFVASTVTLITSGGV